MSIGNIARHEKSCKEKPSTSKAIAYPSPTGGKTSQSSPSRGSPSTSTRGKITPSRSTPCRATPSRDQKSPNTSTPANNVLSQSPAQTTPTRGRPARRSLFGNNTTYISQLTIKTFTFPIKNNIFT